ncbi:hypothetical protein F2P56_036200 [Juglans regia]|uniref:Uncharacterized protein n=2 Tax=Juglans regia TaxID=51240 RepID=A0A833WSV2_JUGRE|nr:uncharacterized protein LOC109006494 [Juglans regia]KAF5443662.1 hypothetical protein F2P56_036200 [Juglans regia]
MGSNALLQYAFKDSEMGKLSNHGRLLSRFGAGGLLCHLSFNRCCIIAIVVAQFLLSTLRKGPLDKKRPKHFRVASPSAEPCGCFCDCLSGSASQRFSSDWWCGPSQHTLGVHTPTLPLCLPYAVFFDVAASLIFGFFPAGRCVFSVKVLARFPLFWVGRFQIIARKMLKLDNLTDKSDKAFTGPEGKKGMVFT